MARKLKVFQTQLGFYDSVVAAPSQAAALRAWGTHHDLFADGMAKVATDEKAIQAALASPEVALKRAIGTTDPFNLTPGLPSLPDLPPVQKTGKSKLQLVENKAAPPAKVSKPRPPPPPDRSALDRAEAELRNLEQQRRLEEQALTQDHATVEAEEAAIARRRAEVEGRQAAASKRHERERSKMEVVLERERQAYDKAAGRGIGRR